MPALVLAVTVYSMVVLGSDEVQGARVTQGAPLSVDHHLTGPSLLPLVQLDVPDVLQVAGVGPSPQNQA